jgi:hypothetical protein
MASPYPVIISAEVHCGSESQIKLVQILKEVFGGQLVTGALPGFEEVAEGRLPSPEQLRYRVLFKVCRRGGIWFIRLNVDLIRIGGSLSDLLRWRIRNPPIRRS